MNNIVIVILYEVAMWIYFICSFPKFIYELFWHQKYRKSFFARLGFYDPKIFPTLGNRSIWIHAVSMGETKAIVSLARALKSQYPNTPLIITSVTETGHAEAKRSLPFADAHLFLPFDIQMCIKPLVNALSPKLVIVSESDIWYHFLRLSKSQGAKICLVNGKISERSCAYFNKFSFFTKSLFQQFDLLCLQNQLYADRFQSIGIPREKIKVTGNLKMDDEYPQLSADEIMHWKDKLAIQRDQIVVTIGSTHDPEEFELLLIMKKIWKEFPRVKLLIVPRHPERFKVVANLLESEKINWISYTDIKRSNKHEQVILVDAMGMLRMCYQLSDIAIVGGSFTDGVGGHNILEPCWYGKPVLFGPYMKSQAELVALMLQAHAGRQVTLMQLKNVLADWIRSLEEREQHGRHGKELINSVKGSMKRTFKEIMPLLE